MFSVKHEGTGVWDEETVGRERKNEASFLKHGILIIIPRAITWKQTTEMNILPYEISVSQSFCLNKILRFHKAEIQLKNICD